jgi:hypothetical protein
MLHEVFDEEVKSCVVCGRDRAPHQCLTFIQDALVREKMRVLEKLVR